MAMTSTAPPEEQCVSVGEEDYMARSREEAQRYIDLIRTKLGPEPPGARLKIKSCPHDFGAYLDVVCEFDDQDEDARNYAYLCESEGPRTWQDDQPLPKKRYGVTAYLTCRLKLTVEAETSHMAGIVARAQARAKAQESGFDLDDYDEVVAEVQEVKEVTHGS